MCGRQRAVGWGGNDVTEHRVIGRPVVRVEDAALLSGRGRYVDDVDVPNMLEAAFVRSPMAHARIRSIDRSAALAAPGVHAVLVFDDLKPVLAQERLPLQFRLDKLPHDITPYPLAKDEVVFVGEAVAVVIADNRYLAEDAANLVEVDYEALEAVADCRESAKPGAVKADTRKASNIVKDWKLVVGDAAVAFAKAPHKLGLSFKTHRGAAHPIEGRAVLANYDVNEDRLTLWDSTQQSHEVRGYLITLLGLEESQIRVIAADVGGGFGAKYLMYSEEVVVAAVSRMLQRPVKWIEDRREHFLSAIQERDQYWDMEVAFDDDGQLLGMRGTMVHDQGAYTPQGVNLPTNAANALPGPYVLPTLDLRVIAAETNKVATVPVRGAGHPQGNFVMERSLDAIAAKLGIDRAEVRRRNLIPPERMPYDTGLRSRSGASITYDTGDYPKMLATCLQAIDYAGFPARQTAARKGGRYIGSGVAMALKGTGRGPFESATVRIDRTGRVCLYTGAVGIGQGINTALAQVCAEQLGVDASDVKVISGDTGVINVGLGAFASRQTVMAGSAVHVAAKAVREKVLSIASELLETSVEDLDLRDGRVEVKGVRELGISFKELGLEMAGVPGYSLPTKNHGAGLEHSHNFPSSSLTYAGICVGTEVEVDIETGAVSILRLATVVDSGFQINPMIVKGQVVGSIVHGLGNALYEWMGYDGEAQPVTTTLAEYLLPTAPEIPNIEMISMAYPGTNNPLGVKGAGETGCVPVPGAVVSAVENALGEFGVRIREFPLSPARMVELLGEGRRRG